MKGKKKYGYLPKPVKRLVDEIVDEMERLPTVARCYDQWQTLQGEVEGYYSDTPPEKKKLSQRKEFRQIKNTVVAEAESLRLSALTFEGEQQTDEDDGYDHSRNHWYQQMKQILDDPEEPIENKDWAVQYTSYDQLPLMLTVPDVSQVLGISLAGTYELVRSDGFPALKIGSRIVVPKEKFIEWVNRQTLGSD